ncbi:MAG: hypothetical protein LBR55_03475, partial [Bacteroidales bacterium]|nr:hypothetical protein [Bacteroidales bacterium]
MRNFSIIPNSSQSAIEQYSDFLSREVYSNMQPYDVNDPLFLQQLGVLQAEGIRRAINNNSAVTYCGFQETNVTIADSANFVGNRIGHAANMITSSLDNGFTTLNNSLVKIDSGIETANTHLSNIHSGIDTVNTNLSNVNQNLNVLGNMVGQGFSALNRGINTTNRHLSDVNKNLNALMNMVSICFSKLYTQMKISNELLGSILTELKIPETQRERRFHIEEGTKYLSIALSKGDKFYFEDAFDEFNKAIAIERKDFFSWFNLGVIYLRSKEHIDTAQAINAFERHIHYAQAEAIHKKNQNLEYQIDDAHLHLAESYYLQQKFKEAISETELCVHIKDKADFMKVKYLSATNENTSKQEAVNILSKLIDKNPYITLQVLEDDDVVRNDFIINLLENLRKDTVKKAKSLLLKIKQSRKESYHIEQTKEIIIETETL